MKEVILIIQKGGKVKILAEGANGKGTEAFTEKLAGEMGRIEERHKGIHHEHTHDHGYVHTGN